MICKCGADMRHQSQGVWFCSRGDRFAVVIGQQAQWFSAESEPEPYLAKETVFIRDDGNQAWIERR